MSKEIIKIQDLKRKFTMGTETVHALRGISFTINEGEFVTIMGSSGSGKSTLLKLIYGLYDLDSGAIIYNGNPILGPKHNLVPGEDYIKYLAQDFDLMPYTTVEENVGKFLSNMFFTNAIFLPTLCVYICKQMFFYELTTLRCVLSHVEFKKRRHIF